MTRTPPRAARARVAIAGWLLIGLGCGEERREPEHPVVIIGFDGLEWSVARPLLQAGEMPNLRGLIERGTSGYLHTEKPAKSPAVWTTVATGKIRKHHGILDFGNQLGVPYTSESRVGKALWNIASDYGLDTCTIGWWVTWPAEHVNGVMVAPYSAAGQSNFNWKGNFYKDLPDQTWPPELLDELWPIAERTASDESLAQFDPVYFGDGDPDALFADLPEDDRERARELLNKLVGQTRWSVEADETYLAIAKHLLSKRAEFPDLTMLYYGGPDVASHRFWQYMRPEEFRYPVAKDVIAAFGETINRFYRRADQILGEVLATVPDDANIIVCSDHGFHASSTTIPSPIGVTGHHLDGPPGMMVMAGPAFIPGQGAKAVLEGKGRILELGYIFDIHPIALYLLGLPVGRTIESPDGGPSRRRALRPELLKARPWEQVPSHDEGFRDAKLPREASEEATAHLHEWLRQLGYTEDSSDSESRPPPDRPREDDSDDR